MAPPNKSYRQEKEEEEEEENDFYPGKPQSAGYHHHHHSHRPNGPNDPNDPNSNNSNSNNPSQEDFRNNSSGGRPIFTLTLDPAALEQEIGQATHAIHSTMNSIFNTVQSSVFDGIEALSQEMSMLEKKSQDFWEQQQEQEQEQGHGQQKNRLQKYHQ
ncbi:hypothetical protein BGZ65_000516, partial [Modicella reniformis]